MKSAFLSQAGWYAVVLLMLSAPLIQGGTPRLPLAAVQCVVSLLLVVWCLEWGWRAPCQSLRVTVLDGLLGLFLFWSVFSMLFAPYHHSAEKALLFLLTGSLLYWWLIFHPSPRGVSHALTAVKVQGVFQAGLVWYQWGVQGISRPSGTFYNPNFLASFLAAAAVLSLGSAIFPPRESRERSAGAILMGLSAAAFMAGALLLSGSRGGVLALAAGLVVLLGGRSLLLSFTGLAGGLLALLLIPNPLIARLIELGRLDVYAYSRFAIWNSALTMMADHPGFGVGLGQFKYFAPRYAFPVETHWARYGRVAETAHNEYLQAGAELGLPGLIMVAALLGVALFAACRAVMKQPPAGRGPTVTLCAPLAVLLVHAAVDFPLHVPPVALLLVLLAAGLRIRGAGGGSWIVDVRFRKVYAVSLMACAALVTVQAVRPAVGFWYFLGGIGAPQNLIREKWSLEEAPKVPVGGKEATALLKRAADIDPRNASYHNALGSMYFQGSRSEKEPEDLRRKGLFHAHYAAELNPNNYRYAASLEQAMESLYRITGKRSFLTEAVQHQLRAVLLGPKLYSLHEKLALLAEEAGDLERAEEAFREVVRLEPHYMRGWYNLGTFLARQGRREEAREALVRGREPVPERDGAVALSPYERTLVDFDVTLFDNRLQEIEEDARYQ
jgi:O-antigen ligase